MSDYRVTINYPNMPAGQELTIPGLGTFRNKSTGEVTKEQADSFRSYQRDNQNDRTLLQAFKDSEFVTVEAVSEEKSKAPSKVKTTEPPVESKTAAGVPTGDHEKGSDK